MIEISSTTMTMQQLLVTGAIIGTVLYMIRTRRKRYKLPPGPKGVPILGYLPYINFKTAHEDFVELGKKYGDVFSIKLGSDDVVIINDYETIKEVLTRDEFQDRPNHFVLALFDPLGQLVTWSGKLWKSQRNFALRSLRTLGFGKKQFEGNIHQEIEYLVHKIDTMGSKGRKGIIFRQLVAPSISNVILLMTTGMRFDFDHEIRRNYDSLFLSDCNEVGFHFFSFLTYFPFVLKLLMMVPTELSRKLNFFYNSANEHLKTVISERKEAISKMSEEELNEPSDNYVDVYLKHMMSMKEENEESRFYTEHSLRGSAFSFLAAGSTTTMDTVQFFCLLMAIHQDVQEEMFSEVSRVLGTDTCVSITDKSNLPITESIIHEVFRISSLIPINLPHSASCDTKIKDFDVPKGTLILANLYAVHLNPKHWLEEREFKYDRFLSEDRSKFVKREHFVAFGVGKRSCPGESMAMLEVLLYTVSLIQRYNILPESELKFQPVMNGFQRTPPHALKLIFEPRKNS